MATEVVARPLPRTRISGGQAAAAVGWLVAALLFSLRFDGDARLVVLALAVGLAGGWVGWVALSRRRLRLTLTGERLVFSGVLRDRPLVAVEQPRRVVDVEVRWGAASSRKTRLWLLVNASGRTALGLNRDAWDERELEGLRDLLGLPLETVETPMRPNEIRRAYPGSVPWWGAHPALATVLLIVVATAAAIALR
jgi:hypothetical protein